MDIAKDNFDSDVLVERVIDSVESSLEGIIARPSRLKWFLAGAFLGSLGVIFLDPVHGQARRSQLKERVSTMGRDGLEFGRTKFQDFQNRAQSLSGSSAEGQDQTSDQTPTQH